MTTKPKPVAAAEERVEAAEDNLVEAVEAAEDAPTPEAQHAAEEVVEEAAQELHAAQIDYARVEESVRNGTRDGMIEALSTANVPTPSEPPVAVEPPAVESTEAKPEGDKPDETPEGTKLDEAPGTTRGSRWFGAPKE